MFILFKIKDLKKIKKDRTYFKYFKLYLYKLRFNIHYLFY